MKPIKLNDTAKEILKEGVLAKFEQAFADYQFNINDTKFSVNFDICFQAQDKIRIVYSPKAFLRMQALVDWYDTEVAWYGFVEKRSDTEYYVYDIKVNKQYVDGAKVDTTDEDTLDFFAGLTDDEAEHMHFQAHSHVKMSTGASVIDLDNQANVVHNLSGQGFYIFQIWNKHGDINTYLYDLDNNMYYDRKDVTIAIEDDMGTTDDFIASTIDQVIEKKTKVTQYSGYQTQWPNQPQQVYQGSSGYQGGSYQGSSQGQNITYDRRGEWDD